jgi:YHS domain-containing protein
MAKDPVCGMEVKECEAKACAEHKGKTYHFCAEACKAEFEKNPAKYAGKSGCCCH